MSAFHQSPATTVTPPAAAASPPRHQQMLPSLYKASSRSQHKARALKKRPRRRNPKHAGDWNMENDGDWNMAKWWVFMKGSWIFGSEQVTFHGDSAIKTRDFIAPQHRKVWYISAIELENHLDVGNSKVAVTHQVLIYTWNDMYINVNNITSLFPKIKHLLCVTSNVKLSDYGGPFSGPHGWPKMGRNMSMLHWDSYCSVNPVSRYESV